MSEKDFIHNGRSAVTISPKKRYGLRNFILCDPKHFIHRFIMLGFMCFLSFGSYYCYDNPAALQRTITQVMDINNLKYNLLYSLYSWPNVFLSLVGGVLIDRFFGVRVGSIIFSCLVTLGQLIFALGGFFDSFITMLLGRFVFGLGGESLAVAQNAYAVLWFKGKELNMVFGLLLSISRVGSTVNMNVNKKMFDQFTVFSNKPKRLGFVLMFGFFFCILSLICALILALFDKRAEKILRRKATKGEQLRLRDIKDFPLSLWLIFIVCVAYYVTVFPFIGLATVFLEDKYFFDSSVANIVNSLVYSISAIASPLFGLAVDKTGFNLVWLTVGILTTLGCHAMFAFADGASAIPFCIMVGMGIAYSILACALWPLVAYVVPEHQLGTAYGIMQSVQNLGLAVVPIIAGKILDTKGYLVLEVFFCACLCCALITAILLYIIDSTRGRGILNLSARKRDSLVNSIAKSDAASESKTERTPLITDGSLQVNSHRVGPASAFYLRNRLLSRMGAELPEHMVRINPLTASIAHVGLLK